MVSAKSEKESLKAQNHVRQTKKDLKLLEEAFSFNSLVHLESGMESTAVLTSEQSYDSQSYLLDGRLAQLIMLNTKLIREKLDGIMGARYYKSEVALLSEVLNERRKVDHRKVIRLPSRENVAEPVSKLIASRRSCREYSGEYMSMKQLSTLLWHGDGISGRQLLPELKSHLFHHAAIPLRTAGSGGRLYPVDMYVAALRVRGLERGLYLYQPLEHSLLAKRLDWNLGREITAAYSTGGDVIRLDKASFIVIFTSKLWKATRKYGDRAFRNVLIEVGEICQNIHLTSRGLGLGTVDAAGFFDTDVERILAIDGVNEYALHTIVGGIPA
jgi:SagB-type dehydrogenase family enzyme